MLCLNVSRSPERRVCGARLMAGAPVPAAEKIGPPHVASRFRVSSFPASKSCSQMLRIIVYSAYVVYRATMHLTEISKEG
jgi:hypothetical protein